MRIARPGEEAGRCHNISCHVIRTVHVVIHDFVIKDDQYVGAKRQQLMFTMLFTALFVEENRKKETKHSLVDAQNYRMPQTNEKRRVHLKFLSQNTMWHILGHISDTKNSRSDVLICEARKGPQTHGIDFMEISDVSHVFSKTF